MALQVRIGDQVFSAQWEAGRSPRTCEAFVRLLPFESRILQARWSGEAGWVPLGARDIGVGYEAPIGEPGPGQLLWHPAGASEAEILVPYGMCRFSSKVGPLQGNHFITLTSGLDALSSVGASLMEQGPLPFVISG